MYDRWNVRGYDRAQAVRLCREGLDPMTAVLLASRGITQAEELADWLNDDLSALSDPMSFKDMDKARDRVRRAQRASDERVLAQSRLAQELSNADVADGLFADRIAELDRTVEAERQNLAAAEEALADLEGREKDIRGRVGAKRDERSRLQGELKDARAKRSSAESALARAEAEHRALERVVAEARYFEGM